MKTKLEKMEEALRLFEQAKVFLQQDEITAEDAEQRDRLIGEGMRLQNEAQKLDEVEGFAAKYLEMKEEQANPPEGKFRSLGHYLSELALTGNPRYKGNVHPYFQNRDSQLRDEGDREASNEWLKTGKVVSGRSRKDLVESVGASGGFLVPVEFRPELLSVAFETNPIRAQATIIPMRRRQINIPTLDQTGTAAGSSRMHGGIVATWTEEAAQKDETEPDFRQVELVAHKLVTYTEISDELLADEAIGLTAFLNGPMGFAGAIRWEEEFTFLQGTGAGQPLGVINANATIGVNRLTANQINPDDLFNMIASHHGESPMWHINRGAMPQILRLNGPAGNPSYIFIDNARESPSMRLFGVPIQWTEKLPALGTAGDVLLADWSFYLIGDRQSITVDSSKDFRFRNDLTAWRAVHRVDGQPWLSQPITLADGVTTISPFVILAGVAS